MPFGGGFQVGSRPRSREFVCNPGLGIITILNATVDSSQREESQDFKAFRRPDTDALIRQTKTSMVELITGHETRRGMIRDP